MGYEIDYKAKAEMLYNLSGDNPHKPFFCELDICEQAKWVSVVIKYMEGKKNNPPLN